MAELSPYDSSKTSIYATRTRLNVPNCAFPRAEQTFFLVPGVSYVESVAHRISWGSSYPKPRSRG